MAPLPSSSARAPEPELRELGGGRAQFSPQPGELRVALPAFRPDLHNAMPGAFNEEERPPMRSGWWTDWTGRNFTLLVIP